MKNQKNKIQNYKTKNEKKKTIESKFSFFICKEIFLVFISRRWNYFMIDLTDLKRYSSSLLSHSESVLVALSMFGLKETKNYNYSQLFTRTITKM